MNSGSATSTIVRAISRHIEARHPGGLTATAFYSATAQYMDSSADAGPVRLAVFLELGDKAQASFYRSLRIGGVS